MLGLGPLAGYPLAAPGAAFNIVSASPVNGSALFLGRTPAVTRTATIVGLSGKIAGAGKNPVTVASSKASPPIGLLTLVPVITVTLNLITVILPTIALNALGSQPGQSYGSSFSPSNGKASLGGLVPFIVSSSMTSTVQPTLLTVSLSTAVTSASSNSYPSISILNSSGVQFAITRTASSYPSTGAGNLTGSATTLYQTALVNASTSSVSVKPTGGLTTVCSSNAYPKNANSKLLGVTAPVSYLNQRRSVFLMTTLKNN